VEPASDRGAIGLRERKKQATRMALQAAALHLFDEHGYGATTVDAIARRADVSRSTFFRYFRSKEDVFFGTDDELEPTFVQSLLDRPSNEGSVRAFEEALVELAVGRADRQQRELTRIRDTLIRNEEGLRLRRERERERWTDIIAVLFAQRSGRGVANLSDRINASICLAVNAEVAREWGAADGPDAVDAIRDAFARARAGIRA
jgi:AcrR family transcriptional regulator